MQWKVEIFSIHDCNSSSLLFVQSCKHIPKKDAIIAANKDPFNPQSIKLEYINWTKCKVLTT